MNYTMIAIFWGVWSTILLHLSKAMERHGIEIFDQIRVKIKNEGSEAVVTVDVKVDTEVNANIYTEVDIVAEVDEKSVKKPTIYIIGLIINNLTPIWAMLATMNGQPSTYFTSMFGIGLIALMFYSTKILHETINKIEYVGVFLLICGAMVIGVESIGRPDISSQIATINLSLIFIIIGIIILIGIIGVYSAIKTKKPLIIGVFFGLFAGACGSLDPTLKGIGQTFGGEAGFLPSTGIGWVVFLISFGAGTIAFTFTQWGFAKKADASVLVPCYNSMYIIIPQIIYVIAIPEYLFYPTTYFGLGLTILGIILMQVFRKNNHHNSHQ